MEHRANHAAPVRWVVMPVCGCGTSEIGRSLAAALQVPFLEGDAYHSATNVAKMAAGTALDDGDTPRRANAAKAWSSPARRCKGATATCCALPTRACASPT